MKKSILIVVLAITLQSFSQIDIKNIENVPMANPIEIIDTPGPSALGGDDVLWSEDFADETTPNIITEDVAGFGDWKWSDQSPGGQWSENAGVIQSETPNNGFMIMEADFYNTSPQNDVPDGQVGENPLSASFTIGPIDLLALVLIYIFAFNLDWFPLFGGYAVAQLPEWSFSFIGQVIHHAILPASSIVLASLGFWALGMRGMMVTNQGEDFMIAAEAKGLRSMRLFFNYAVRNAILPQTTALALSLGTVFNPLTTIKNTDSREKIQTHGCHIFSDFPGLTTQI